MNSITGYISRQFDKSSSATYAYPSDYMGSIQLLEKAGFSPFTDNSPLNSTLYQVFNRFVQKTGMDTTANKLKDEYLEQNPAMQRAMNLYSSLDNTFSSRRPGEQAAIVDFLNNKIDEFITQKDKNSDKTLSNEESGLQETLFQAMDENRDNQVTGEEIKNNFYNDFTQLNNVLNYFQNNTGTLVDLYA